MHQDLDVLIVDDSLDDAELILHELRRSGFEPHSQRVDSRAAMETALRSQDWDVVVSDFSMPGFNGFDALGLARAKDIDLPFILISGAIGEETAVAAMKAGAHDYLMKDNLARLAPAIERELREAKNRREKKAQTEAWQRELETRVKERTSELSLAHRKLQAAVGKHRDLEAAIARVIEREQLRLGQELHDGLGQQLAGIKYLLMAMQSKAPAALREPIEKIHSLLQESVQQTRHLAQAFYPVDMENFGLFIALEHFALDGALSQQIACTLEADDSERYSQFKGPAAIQMFRIAQESIHNAVKHSKATEIKIRLVTDDGNLTLTVKDNGVGLKPGAKKTRGMGMHIMQYRAETMGGTLKIQNRPRGGVAVTCSIPLDRFG